MELTISKAINRKDIGFYPGLILGLLCTINGFMFQLGSLNIRLSDLPYYIIILYFFVFKSNIRQIYPKRLMKSLFIIFIIFVWLTIIGFINFSNFNDLYQEFYIKYYINKVMWILIYAAIYMIFGGRNFLYGVICGIGICSLINSAFVIYEYISIQNGYLPEYDFLKHIGIVIDEKKNMVINQGMIRPTGLMLDPNYTGAYCGLGSISFYYIYYRHRKKLYLLCCILSALPMLILFSRTGIFSFLLCYLISLYYHFKDRSHYPMLAPQVVVISLIIGIAFLSYIFSIDDKVYQQLVDRLFMNDSSASTRTDYIFYYLKLASPFQLLFGVGLSGFFLSNFWGYQNIVWAPESSVLTLIIENGLLFNICFYIIIIKTFFNLIKHNYFYALILAYINFIGISYNFLGDRVFYSLTVFLIMFSYVKAPIYQKNINLLKIRN